LLQQDKDGQEDTLYFVHKLTNRILWTEKQKQRKEGVQAFTAFYEKEEHLMKVIDSYLRCEDIPDRDVVIFSILVHDIGKILEYTHHGDTSEKYKLWFPHSDIPLNTDQMGVSMDPHGSHLGHITLGAMFVYRYWLSGKYPKISYLFWFDVLGCVLSHHGRLDWGSSKEPETVNEWLVHLCDFIDSKYANEK
jgi:3'-5' exoribonuclease